MTTWKEIAQNLIEEDKKEQELASSRFGFFEKTNCFTARNL